MAASHARFANDRGLVLRAIEYMHGTGVLMKNEALNVASDIFAAAPVFAPDTSKPVPVAASVTLAPTVPLLTTWNETIEVLFSGTSPKLSSVGLNARMAPLALCEILTVWGSSPMTSVVIVRASA